MSTPRCPHCHAPVSRSEASCPQCRGTLPTEHEGSRESDLIGGNFRLLSLLGKGGMGAVWLAEDAGLQRKVAVKLLAEKLCHDPELVERFLREARLMAKVDHPNIVPVHLVGRWGHVPFIVMKYLSGHALAEHAQTHPVTLHEVTAVTRQICQGLSALHAQGIVHRDIKPQNIFICDGGQVVLLDLGIARERDSSLTGAGVLVGSPRYIAPEQAQGMPVDASADVYSLGVVLYELFAGRPMFEVDSSESQIRAHVYARPERLTTVPDAVWRVVAKAVEKEPSQRFRSAAELSTALDAAVATSGEGTSTTFAGPWSARRPSSRSSPVSPSVLSSWGRRAPLLAGTGAALVAAAGLVAWALRQPSPVVTPPVVAVLANETAADAGAPREPAPDAAPATHDELSAAPPPPPPRAARPERTRPLPKPAPAEEEPPPLLPR